jgi:hypothetical protein
VDEERQKVLRKNPLLSGVPKSVSSRVNCKCVCQVWVRGGSWEEVANTMDTEELPNFQRCATHPRELGYEARQILPRSS